MTDAQLNGYRDGLPPPRIAPRGWRDEAACRPADPALFFPPDGETPEDAAAREAQANTWCAGCPVVSDCLAFGLTQQYGHWGGMNEHDRVNRNRRTRRAQREQAA